MVQRYGYNKETTALRCAGVSCEITPKARKTARTLGGPYRRCRTSPSKSSGLLSIPSYSSLLPTPSNHSSTSPPVGGSSTRGTSHVLTSASSSARRSSSTHPRRTARLASHPASRGRKKPGSVVGTRTAGSAGEAARPMRMPRPVASPAARLTMMREQDWKCVEGEARCGAGGTSEGRA